MKKDKSKSPWRWLLKGDKGGFMIAWLIAGTIATMVTWEYGFRTIMVTVAFFGTVFGILCGYRLGRYWDAVRNMDILSFSDWRKSR